MSNVIYRKYRSKTFSSLIGQEHVKTLLVESIAGNNIHHAYLFAGPRGTGKTTTARLMAKAINDPNFSKNKDIDLEHNLVQLIESGSSMDIVELDAASNRGIEEIRQLKENIQYLPSQLKYKVYIIDEAHMLTKEAFNALLKTLEEPPAHVVMILATTEPHKLPITILSRVQRYDFRLASKEEILKKLKHILDSENTKYEEEGLNLLFEASGGSFRDAESLLSKFLGRESSITESNVKAVLGVVGTSVMKELTDSILKNNLEQSLRIVRDISEQGLDLNYFIDQYIKFVKDGLVNAALNSEASSHKLKNIIFEFIRAKSDSKLFDSVLMLLELTLVSLIDKSTSSTEKSEGEGQAPNIESKQSIIKKRIAREEQAAIKEDPKGKIVGGSEESEGEEQVSQIDPAAVSGYSQEIVGSDVQLSEQFSDDQDLISKFKSICDSKSPRLKAILNSSVCTFENGVFLIKNKYQFNIKFLEKPETLSLIKQIFDDVGEDLQKVVAEKNDEEIFQEKNQQQYKTTKPSGEVFKDPHAPKDNSDLVESILL